MKFLLKCSRWIDLMKGLQICVGNRTRFFDNNGAID